MFFVLMMFMTVTTVIETSTAVVVERKVIFDITELFIGTCQMLVSLLLLEAVWNGIRFLMLNNGLLFAILTQGNS